MRVGVVGGGLMGSGIAEVCARSAIDVTVVEIDPGLAEATRRSIERSMERALRAGKLDPDAHAEAAARLAYTTSLEDLEGADVAIEAVVEAEDAKREVFRRLDQVLPEAR